MPTRVARALSYIGQLCSGSPNPPSCVPPMCFELKLTWTLYNLRWTGSVARGVMTTRIPRIFDVQAIRISAAQCFCNSFGPILKYVLDEDESKCQVLTDLHFLYARSLWNRRLQTGFGTRSLHSGIPSTAYTMVPQTDGHRILWGKSGSTGHDSLQRNLSCDWVCNSELIPAAMVFVFLLRFGLFAYRTYCFSTPSIGNMIPNRNDGQEYVFLSRIVGIRDGIQISMGA